LPSSYIAIFTQCILSNFLPPCTVLQLYFISISFSLTRTHVSDKPMNNSVLNSIETNPWSLTNSNALSSHTHGIHIHNSLPFFTLLAYRFSTQPTYFILTAIFYSLFSCLILLILLYIYSYFTHTFQF